MPVILLVIFLAVGWTFTGVWSVFRIRGLRESNDYLEDARYEATQAALDAEKRAGSAEMDAQYAKLTLANVLQRPSLAQFTEENIQQLGALIQSFMVKPGMEN